MADVDVEEGSEASQGGESDESGGLDKLSKTVSRMRRFQFLRLLFTLIIVVGLVSHTFYVYRAASSLEYVEGDVDNVALSSPPDEYEAVFVLHLKNPTRTNIDVDWVEYDVFIEGEFVGNGDKGSFSILPGTREYSFRFSFNLEDMSSSVQGVFLEESFTMKIQGEAMVPLKVFGLFRWSSVTVPWSLEEDVNLEGDAEDPDFPPAPVALTLTRISTDSVRLDWTISASPNFDRYEVHMSTENGFEPSNDTNIDEFFDITPTHTTVGDLDLDETYYFRVRVVDTSGLYADSNQERFPIIPLSG